MGVREERRQSVKAAERQKRLLLQNLEGSVELEWGLGRQRPGDEGPDALALDRGDRVSARQPALHGSGLAIQASFRASWII